jgi:predicted ATPase
MSSDILEESKDYLVDYFRNSIKYVGPLRFYGSVHPFSEANDPKDVGVSGEYLASVIDPFKNVKIEYLPPPEKNGTFSGSQSRIEKDVDFIVALIKWLKYLKVVNNIKCKQLKNHGYELKVKLSSDKEFRDFTRVGAGVSQVLPIVVTCLLADRDSTLIFQQPEEHLHPRVQSRLADFFLSMALLDRQCIVETHSEYLVYGLRYRLSQALLQNNETIKNAKKEDATKLYFAEKNDGKSIFKEIKVMRHGGISDWPDDFFDEQQKISEKMMGIIFAEMDDNDE